MFTQSQSVDYKISEIQQKIFEIFKDYDYVPEIFKVRKSFPFAKFGKRDISLMKNETEDFKFYEKQLIVSK